MEMMNITRGQIEQLVRVHNNLIADMNKAKDDDKERYIRLKSKADGMRQAMYMLHINTTTKDGAITSVLYDSVVSVKKENLLEF